MKKKIYLTILAVVTVFCIIFGTLRHMGVFGHSENVRYDTEKMQIAGNDFSGGGNVSGGNVSRSESGTADENAKPGKNGNADRNTNSGKNAGMGENAGKSGTGLQAEATNSTVTEMHAEIDYGSLIVKIGDEFSAEYNGSNDYKPDVSLKNGVLTIFQKTDSWNFFRNIMNPKAELTITLPKGTVLNTADIRLDLGDADVSGLTIKNGTVVNNMGNIEIAYCRLGTMNIEADLGDVQVEKCEFYDLYIEEDLGKVRVFSAKDLTGAEIHLETDLGKVLVNGNDQGTAYSVSGAGDIRLSVQNDMGDVELEY